MKRIISLILITIFISVSSNKKSFAKEFLLNNSIKELDKNFIEVDGQNLEETLWNEFYSVIHCFKIGFNTKTQRIFVQKITNSYFSNYIGYNKYLDIKILDKNSKEKLHLELEGWDYFTSGKVSKLNNFKYEYGDIIKLSGKVPERQSIFGRVIDATKDYSKGLNNVQDIENLGFQITENGLKEIRNKAPIIKNVENLKIIKNSKFDSLSGISVIDDLDGDITKDLVVEGDVHTNTIGEYYIKYKVKDSWNKKSEVTRKVTVVENPKLNENIINVNGELSPLGEERFNIGFDDFKKKIKVEKYENEIKVIGSSDSKFKFNPKFNKKIKNKKYFSVEIFNKRKYRKLFLQLNGEDDSNSSKLNPLVNFNYEYGDVIKLWHGNPNNLEILGTIINAKEDYTDGIQGDIEEVLFEITKNGLKAIYNKAPEITGVEDIKIKIGENFDPLKDVKIKDDYETNLIPKVTGNVNINKLGKYELNYYVKDNWGRETIVKRVVTVRSNNKPIITLKNKDIVIEQDSQVDDNYLLNLITATDYEDGNLIEKVNVKSNINSEKPGNYEVVYKVQDSDGNIFYLKREVIVIRSLSVSIPTKIAFQVVTNAVNKKFIVADYKIINHKKSSVKVYLKSFNKESGELNIVPPNTFSHWDDIGQADSMSKLALGLYIKDDFKKGSHFISNPIWLNNNMNNKTYLGEISGDKNFTGKFSFVAKHGERFTGANSKGKYSLVLEFE